MTHILGLGAKVRRNEWLWWTLEIGNMSGPTFGFKNLQDDFKFKEKNYHKNLQSS